VTTGGQSTADLYAEVAKSLLVEVEEFNFDDDDLPELQKVVSNRVANLKKIYREYREQLGETGQGLVENDREDEITAGTTLGNLWDLIQVKFP